MHPSLLIALGHFLMNDPASRGHPLHVASRERPAISKAVAMVDRAGQHIRDRLDPAMRMPRKSREIFFGDVVAEIVEQEEGIELARRRQSRRRAGGERQRLRWSVLIERLA